MPDINQHTHNTHPINTQYQHNIAFVLDFLALHLRKFHLQNLLSTSSFFFSPSSAVVVGTRVLGKGMAGGKHDIHTIAYAYYIRLRRNICKQCTFVRTSIIYARTYTRIHTHATTTNPHTHTTHTHNIHAPYMQTLSIGIAYTHTHIHINTYK